MKLIKYIIKKMIQHWGSHSSHMRNIKTFAIFSILLIALSIRTYASAYSNNGIEVKIDNTESSGAVQDLETSMAMTVKVKVKNKNMYSDADIDIFSHENNTFKSVGTKSYKFNLPPNAEITLRFSYLYKGYHTFYIDKKKREVHIKADIDDEKVYSYIDYINEVRRVSGIDVSTKSIIEDLERLDNNQTIESKKGNFKFPIWLIVMIVVIVCILLAIVLLKYYKEYKNTYYSFIAMIFLSALLVIFRHNILNAKGVETFLYGKRYSNTYSEKVYHANLPHNMSYTISYKYNGENPYINDLRDFDGDGLSNAEEVFYMSDVNSIDTDSDGLTDYVEVLKLQLSPIDIDTDNNGIKDSDEDSDKDKLSNIDEVNGIEVLGQVYYSDPSEIDTDADGLSDYEEVKGINIYNFISDPNLTDTDNDGLSDFEELEINEKYNLSLSDEDRNKVALNPRNEISNGIDRDIDRKFEQVLSNDMFDSSLYKENAIIPKITANAAGYIDNYIKVKEDKSEFVINNDAIIGKVLRVDNDYNDTRLTVSFDVSRYSEKKEYFKIATYKDGKVQILNTVVDGDYISSEINDGVVFVIDSVKYVDMIISYKKDNWK